MSIKQSVCISLVLIAIGIASRFLPHPWNTTPITAIALFSSVYLGFRYSFAIFLTTMVITDVFIGFYQWPIMLAVYGSFLLAGVVGLYVRRHKSVMIIGIGALSSSIVFFLITNWAVWQFGSMYEHSFSGLMQSYTMAIPFFRNSLIGDLFYTGAFFGIFEGVRYVVLRGLHYTRTRYI